MILLDMRHVPRIVREVILAMARAALPSGGLNEDKCREFIEFGTISNDEIRPKNFRSDAEFLRSLKIKVDE